MSGSPHPRNSLPPFKKQPPSLLTWQGPHVAAGLIFLCHKFRDCDFLLMRVPARFPPEHVQTHFQSFQIALKCSGTHPSLEKI